MTIIVKFVKKSLLISFFLYLPLQSMAWGVLGHRIIGGLAEAYLAPAAKAAIKKILGNESLAMCSNWADFIKSDPAYNYLSPWHYTDYKDGYSRDELLALLETDTTANAYTKLNFLVEELKKGGLPADKKLMYLRLVVHIAGDLHQPFHVGRDEDQGGNRIKVLWFNQPSNMHRVWDEHLIEYQQLSYTEYIAAIDFPTPDQKNLWIKQPLKEWVWDAYQISRQLYDEVKEPEPKLGYRYNFDHLQLLNNQLLKGGIRLAGLLNEIFQVKTPMVSKNKR